MILKIACNPDMNKICISLVVLGGFTALVLWAQAPTPPANPSEAEYEYASIRYDGDLKTQVFFPDGRVEKLHQITGVKRPAKVDERMWDFTMAMNFFAKSGYEPIPGISRTDSDLSFRRKLKH